MSYDYMFKFIIIGDAGVGKSCLLLQFIDNKFRGKYQTTIGVQFGAKIITTKNKAIKLQIWDTAGQQSFKSITRGYYRSAAGAVLVYDITCKSSFNNIIKWLEEAKNYGNEQMTFLLVGNKCDLQQDREVTYQEGYQFAKQNGLQFLQTSAKTAYQVQTTFQKSAELILTQIDKQIINIKNQPVGIKCGEKTPTCSLQHNIKPPEKSCSC